MTLIFDIALAVSAIGAGFYCFILARRLSRLNNLEQGVGGAVATLASQVDELTSTIRIAMEASDSSGQALTLLTDRAENVSRQLELMMASLHDVKLPSDEPEHSSTRHFGESDEPIFHSTRTQSSEVKL